MITPLKILVADDNPTDRLLLSTIVKKEGHDVITAVDGLDAIEKFNEVKPQLVLLDALMPRMDGFDVAKHIKSADSDAFVPVIFMTSLSDTAGLARCLDAGGDDFISKPYSKVVLRAKINALERVRQLYTSLQEQRDVIKDHNLRMVQEQTAAKDIFDNVTLS